MSEHRCHALGCDATVPPRLFMCLRHWRRLPRAMQRMIWSTYRPGQEIDKRPSDEYLLAAAVCRLYVALKEGHELTSDLQLLHDRLWSPGKTA